MVRYIISVCIILSIIACGAEAPRKTFSAYKNGEILVKFRPGAHETQESDTHRLLGAKMTKRVGPGGIERVKLPEGMSVEEAIKAYEANPGVEYAEPNYLVKATVIPNDARFTEQWGLRNTGQRVNGVTGTTGADIKAPEAWDITHGSSGFIVAVIDTGVDGNHPDLTGNLMAGHDFVDDDSEPDDLSGHGTHIAGIIGASGNNAIGVAGINWAVKIMPLKVLDNNGEGTIADVIEAIDYAAAHNARVVNMSFSGPDFSQSLYNSIKSYPDILFVAAAGNGGDDQAGDNNDISLFAEYPASFDLSNILSVAATDQNDNLAPFSNYGSISVDVAAPGMNILSTIPSYIAGVTYSGAYNVVYFSFGFEGINGVNMRRDVMQRVLDFHGMAQNDTILLVDDDGGDTYETFYSQSLLSLGYSFDSHVVPPQGDGPNAAMLNQYKLVIWFTGDEYVDTLRPGDQINLQAYLNNNGHFFVTGQDIGYDIGTGSFYQNYLHALYVTDDANGTDYTGINHLNGLSIELPVNTGDGARNQATIDAVKPLDSSAAFYIHYSDAYQFFRGTSMATPMVSGIAALVGSYYGGLNVDQLKGALMGSVDAIQSLQGKVVTGGRINAFKALTSLIPPANLTAAAQSETNIMLTWTDNSDGENGFSVERKEPGKQFHEIASVPSNQMIYSDNSVNAGTTYTYRVRAFNAAAFSGYTNEAVVTVPGTKKSGGGGGGGCTLNTGYNHQAALADMIVLLSPLLFILLLRRSQK
jgi:subtilisin family serine protease